MGRANGQATGTGIDFAPAWASKHSSGQAALKGSMTVLAKSLCNALYGYKHCQRHPTPRTLLEADNDGGMVMAAPRPNERSESGGGQRPTIDRPTPWRVVADAKLDRDRP